MNKDQYYYKENNGDFTNSEDKLLTLHREGGPAIIKLYPNGFNYFEAWYKNGKQHREDGPSLEEYNGSGYKLREVYTINGVTHREDGPAIIYYNRPAEVHQYNEFWLIDGKELEKRSHSVENPQLIQYFYYKENNGIRTENKNYMLTLHREDGPAIFWQDKNGKIKGAEWYLEGIKVKN